jgi:hypothetical protein
MMFCIPNYDIYWTDSGDGHKGITAVAVKKDIPHTSADLPPLLSVQEAGVCIPIENTNVCLLLFINL